MCKDYWPADKYVPGYCNSIKDFVICEGNKEACEDLIDVLATQAQRESRMDAVFEDLKERDIRRQAEN